MMSKETKDRIREKLRAARTTHGRSRTPTYHYWCKIRKTNKSDFCAEWMDFSGFLSDMGERPAGKFLARMSPNEPFCKDNCYWSESKSNARILRYGKTSMTQNEWAKRFGVSSAAIASGIIRKGSFAKWVEGR